MSRRESLILGMEIPVRYLIYKLVKHWDDDLYMIGMYKVCLCVDNSLKKNLPDEDIKKRCFVWAKNEMLNDLKKYKMITIDDEVLENREVESLDELITLVKLNLNETECKLFDLLLEGKTKDECMKIFSIKSTKYKELIREIKGAINESRL